jgi:hypothetical protein
MKLNKAEASIMGLCIVSLLIQFLYGRRIVTPTKPGWEKVFNHYIMRIGAWKNIPGYFQCLQICILCIGDTLIFALTSTFSYL